MNTRLRFAMLATTLWAGALVSSAALAQDVNVQLRVITPHIRLPGHVVLPLPPLIVPRVVVSQPQPVWQAPPPPPRRDPGYREPTRWDADGDGVPNRYDRVYNPRWDRDGDGVPNRHDRVYNPRWDRDGDGVPNRYDPTPQGGRGWHGHRDWREPAREERRGEWREGRRDERREDHRRGRHD